MTGFFRRHLRLDLGYPRPIARAMSAHASTRNCHNIRTSYPALKAPCKSLGLSTMLFFLNLFRTTLASASPAVGCCRHCSSSARKSAIAACGQLTTAQYKITGGLLPAIRWDPDNFGVRNTLIHLVVISLSLVSRGASVVVEDLR